MSRFYEEISSIDTMPSHVETPSRVMGRTVRKAGFESRILFQDQDRSNLQSERNNCLENLTDQSLKPSSTQGTTLRFQSKFNEDFKLENSKNKSVTSRTFGLQAWNHFGSSGTRSHLEKNLSLNQKISDQYHSNTMLGVSKTFGLVSENMSYVKDKDNEISNSFRRGNTGVNFSLMPRTFGLQSKNLTVNSQFFSENNLRGNLNSDVNHRKFNTEQLTMPKMSNSAVWGSEKVGAGLNELNSEGFIRDLRRYGSDNSSFMCRPFENQLKNSTMHSNFLAENNVRLTQNSNFRSNNNFATTYETLGPELRSSTLTTESHVQDNVKFNNETVDNSEFKRPSLSRVIRGRNSVLSSRLFNHQNMERHCRNLSNMNGFNVSHISRRDVDSVSESRLALNTRSNYADNQSIAGSTMSGASMKAQFLNLLENLHHSILNIGPRMTAEAVRMEFDKAKQGLESLSEVSFAPSIKEFDANSIISQSSKYKCPPINEPSRINVIDGGSLHLKSSKEVLKTLMCSKTSQKKIFNLSTHVEEEGKEAIAGRESQKHSDDEETLQFLFKKPKPYSKRKKSLNSTKTKAGNTTIRKNKKSEAGKKKFSEKTSTAVSLKEWYPIVFGSDLAFCGVNEEGISVKTDPVKKRLNSRQVELINGLYCNLIGSPSKTVSVLPEKIAKLLKNGLTDRWRVLQKELLNCQIVATGQKKRESRGSISTLSPSTTTPRSRGRKVSKSPKSKNTKIISSPRKFKIKPLSGQKIKSKAPKIEISSTKGRDDSRTRSGRTVKPPAMYWLVLGKEELDTIPTSTVSTNKRSESPAKKSDKTTIVSEKKRKWQKKGNDSLTKDVKASRQKSPEKLRTPRNESVRNTSKRNTPMVTTPNESTLKMKELKVGVQLLKEDAERLNKRYQTRNKRKREVGGENDSVQNKKSKLEKKLESHAKESEPVMKKEKKIKGKSPLKGQTPKSVAKKSPAKKNNKLSKKGTTKKTEKEGKKEKKDLNEFEEDFELQLDNIEIPEIANVSGNPKLSRSQLRLVSMETPPLKYFNSNLRLFGSATPIRSPDWCISQRTESEVKRFQKRREEALKKRTKTGVKKIIVSEKATKTVQNKDLKRVMEWVTEKTIKSPVWKSKVLQYVMPSRRKIEQEDYEAEEDEDVENLSS